MLRPEASGREVEIKWGFTAEVISWFSITHQGKRIQETLKTDNKKLAEKLYAKVLTDIVEGRYFEKAEAKKHTFNDMMEKFMREHAVKREISTQVRYEVSLKNLNRHFNNFTLADVTPKTIFSIHAIS